MGNLFVVSNSTLTVWQGCAQSLGYRYLVGLGPLGPLESIGGNCLQGVIGVIGIIRESVDTKSAESGANARRTRKPPPQKYTKSAYSGGIFVPNKGAAPQFAWRK